MTQLIPASQLSLSDVIEKFNLQEVQDRQFFREWQDDLPELNDIEKQWLDGIKADFLSLKRYPLHEEVVKLAVLGPLLSLAGFFRYPFYPEAEAEVRIEAEDEGEIVRGRIDVLVLRRLLWVAAIEAKNKQFDVEEALPQALLYMMANPITDRHTFGFATNGSQFIFIKLNKQEAPQYALSDMFTLRRQENELYDVLCILKRLGELVTR